MTRVHIPATSSYAGKSSAELFLEFQYPEIKDLLKHFLTLISGSLVFSVVFSDRIVGVQDAGRAQVGLAFAGWFFLLVALGLCGLGIYTLYLTAERALVSVAREQATDFQSSARLSYRFQDLAALTFGLGLLLLVVAGAARLVL